MKLEIDVEIPDGWRFVAWRRARGEYYVRSGDRSVSKQRGTGNDG